MQPDTRDSTRRLAPETRECCTQFRIGYISGHGFQQLARTRGYCTGPLCGLPASPKVERRGAHLKADQFLEQRLGAQCPRQGFVRMSYLADPYRGSGTQYQPAVGVADWMDMRGQLRPGRVTPGGGDFR